MKLVPIYSERKKPSNIPLPQPPAVSINLHSFTLNNLAVSKLCEIWGSVHFSIQIFVSECGNFVAFGAKEPNSPKTGLPKSVNSKEARELLNIKRTSFVGTKKLSLKEKDGLLVAEIPLEKRAIV